MDLIEVQKVVSSRPFRRAKEFMKKHAEIMDPEMLRRRSYAAGHVGVINEAIFTWF